MPIINIKNVRFMEELRTAFEDKLTEMIGQVLHHHLPMQDTGEILDKYSVAISHYVGGARDHHIQTVATLWEAKENHKAAA